MAKPTYSERVLVLKRTKLGEYDVICTFMTEQGAQIRAVAKGGRKPTSPFSSRLELFCVCDVLFAQGKNLDIVKEVRLVESNSVLRSAIERYEAACPVLEFLAKTTQEGLPFDQLFNLTTKAFHTLCKADTARLPQICAGALLKEMAFTGFRPRFYECVFCGNTSVAQNGRIAFSSFEGGVVCSECLKNTQVVFYDEVIIKWCQALLFSSFDNIASYELPHQTITDVLVLIDSFVMVHAGVKLSSLKFYLAHPL